MRVPVPENDRNIALPTSVITDVPIAEHLEAVAPGHRRRVVARCGQPWDMAHLDPFAFLIDPGLGFDIVVVVHFSSHCFTRSLKWDGRPMKTIPAGELFNDGQDIRVLCEQRHALSLMYLPQLIRELPQRPIRFARDLPQNFITSELIESDAGRPRQHYVMFFEVSRDPRRKRRLLLKVQSAYLKDALEPRLIKGRRISFATLLKATCTRQPLKG